MSAVVTAKDLLDLFVKASAQERIQIFERAENELTATQKKKFKSGAADIMSHEKSDDEDTVATPGPSSAGPKGKNPAPPAAPVVSDSEVDAFWKELDALDFKTLIDDQIIKDFQYVGFDPNRILKAIIALGRKAGRTNQQIKTDIASMCTIALIKGSVTDNNLKKMSDEGQRTYQRFETTYELKRGGSKGLSPEVITVARVAASFPGAIMQILITRPTLAKKFVGPFGSRFLPTYLQHQSAAACIPASLDFKVKNFILGLITAYTADQSKVISKTKDTPLEIFDRQIDFINQTHGANFPTENVRKTIFANFALVADWDLLVNAANNLKRLKTDFELISKADLENAVQKVT